MEQGPVEELIIQQCAKNRQPLPAKFANVPELWPGLDVFYQAFFDLITCRSQGWGEGPIPWTAINEYAMANGYEGEHRDDLFYHVRSLDKTFLEWRRKKEKK